MRRFHTLAIVGALTLATHGPAANAAFQYIFFHDDKTITGMGFGNENSSQIVIGYTAVDDEGNFTGPASPTITLNADGAFDPELTDVYNSSQLIVNGESQHPGRIYTGLNLHDASMLTVNSGGQVDQLVAGLDASTIIVNGGSVGALADGPIGVVASVASSVTISGGDVYGVKAISGATGLIKGGTVDGDVEAGGGSTFTISGGSITGSASADGDSTNGFATLKLTGGEVAGSVSAGPDSNVNVQTAAITGSLQGGAGSLTFQSGTAASFNVSDPGGISSMDGGTISGDVTAASGGLLNVTAGEVMGNASATDAGTDLELTGGTIDGGADSYSGGFIHLGGSPIAGNVTLHDNSQIFMDAGSVAVGKHVEADDQSIFTMTGGSIDNLFLTGSAAVIMSGGTAGHVLVSDNSNFNFFSGSVTAVSVETGANANLAGGDVAAGLAMSNSATAFVQGSTIEGGLTMGNSSSIIITSGDILGNVNASGSSVIDLESAGVSALVGDTITLRDSAKILIEGVPPSAEDGVARRLGSPISILAHGDDVTPSSIYLYDNASLEIDGVDLTASLLDPNNAGMFSEYSLAGFLQDGTGIPDGFDLFVENGSTASFQLVPEDTVPEPASVALLGGFGFVALRSSRCRAR